MLRRSENVAIRGRQDSKLAQGEVGIATRDFIRSMPAARIAEISDRRVGMLGEAVMAFFEHPAREAPINASAFDTL